MFYLENFMQTLCMIGIVISSYNMVYWWKKEKPVRLIINLLFFLYMFTMYDLLEYMYMG